eukprot:1138531-Pelagomonas_calceolata.AAC.11
MSALALVASIGDATHTQTPSPPLDQARTCALKQVALSVRLDVAVPVHGHEGGTTQEACHRDQQDGGRLGGALLAEVPPEGGVAGQDDVQLDHAGEGQEDQGRLLQGSSSTEGKHTVSRGARCKMLCAFLSTIMHSHMDGRASTYRVVGGGNDGGVVEHGNQHQDPGGDLEVKDEDGKEEEAQDEHGGGHAVDDVHLQAAEDLAGAHDGNDDGADTLLQAHRAPARQDIRQPSRVQGEGCEAQEGPLGMQGERAADADNG